MHEEVNRGSAGAAAHRWSSDEGRSTLATFRVALTGSASQATLPGAPHASVWHLEPINCTSYLIQCLAQLQTAQTLLVGYSWWHPCTRWWSEDVRIGRVYRTRCWPVVPSPPAPTTIHTSAPAISDIPARVRRTPTSALMGGMCRGGDVHPLPPLRCCGRAARALVAPDPHCRPES